ncbi:DUF4845 domain-containing protein [Thauera linaloolentis]|uniref:DUF4845 domain-containing protein n=1 Tax=Thauera linaloolentis (strain DSM 12138 / JCM 21573 / CCUG 41526 / CIP 105981 / IAM 15112 / NBRC 102519 / 47Lol) TaxID=1123367 RepID=N6Z1R0_THAL4|nr:DUF4845 domain-containing protein [Thauera linaloolentis]ENO88537.1 hypothetical protein C666_08485 [Thauera linaloolentis 47Lol = DSM 12138]MCM8564886.1 DUF4845 domain-containing protein [Thauera linaloolentis]
MGFRHQRGVSLVGVLLIGAIGVCVLLMAFRSVPAVTEYMAIQRTVGVLAAEGDNGASVAELRQGFGRRSEVDDISSVTAADLEITKEGNQTVVEVHYERVVPMVANVSLLIDFHASSKAR